MGACPQVLPSRIQRWPLSRAPVAPQVYQSASGRTFRLRPRNDEEVEDRPSKTQRLDDDEVLGVELMEALEEAESDTIHLTTLDNSMPLIICDEPQDLSFLSTGHAHSLSEATACTRYGELRQSLSDQAALYMMAELCDDKSTADPVGASIFDHDSSEGLGLEDTEDH